MKYNKLVWAVLGTVALGLKAALADNTMSTEDYVTVAAAAVAAFGTWLVPNTEALATAKLWVNALVLGAGVLLPLLPEGINGQEVWTVVIAVLTAAGVFVAPNERRAVRRPRVTPAGDAGPTAI